MLTLEEFEDRVRACYETIPPQYVERVAGPVVVAAPHPHPELPGNYLLGECHHTPDFSGTGDLFSTVYLYYGSFVRIAAEDPSFDVEAEIKETVLHEVQHHVEDAAGGTSLCGLDFAEEERERLLAGDPFTDRFWRAGEPIEDEGASLFAVGPDLFREVELARRDEARARDEGLCLRVLGRRVVIDPTELVDLAEAPSLIQIPGHGRPGQTEPGSLFVDVRLRRGLLGRAPR